MSFFPFFYFASFFMLCESGFLLKHSTVRYKEKKKQVSVNCRAWGQESVRISVIARVRNRELV